MRQVMAHGGDARLFHTDFSACNDYLNGLDAAAKVTSPAHLVLARQDQMTSPRNAGAIADALAASVQYVPGGHFLMQEQPDPVLTALQTAFA
jgi:surfactin synthase thioesterase subunit